MCTTKLALMNATIRITKIVAPKIQYKTAPLEESTLSIYHNETLVSEAYRKYRLSNGVACKKCGSKDHYWLSTKEQFQCKKCKFRTTLRSGSIMENSKLPIHYLFIACHLLLKTGNRLTAEQLQHFTGHKYFEPLWSLLRKIKDEMPLAQQYHLLLHFIEEKQNEALASVLASAPSEAQ